MVTYEKASLKVAEFFFDEEEAQTSADIVRYQYRSQPVSGCASADFHTLWLDLGADRDSLYGKMNKGTRYEIRRAEKEDLTYQFASSPSIEWVEDFLDFYNRFAESKGLPAANRPRIMALMGHGALDLSRVVSSDTGVLVWHAYIRTFNRARLLHSASLFRTADKASANLAGRANRLNHWEDILRFQGEGVTTYDFGGWYMGDTDTEKIRINQFKLSFGGDVVHLYNADRANSWKGAAVLRARQAMHGLLGEGGLMAASYLVRFDDLTPAMNWTVWRQVESALTETGVKPILAVVPDNRDPELNVGAPEPRFWDHVRRWQSWGWTIGLHGYQHCYETQHSGILGRNRYSEFAGLGRDTQLFKVRRALDIFQREGVIPDAWIAPAHSFDEMTLDVLAENGIRHISDGYSLLPHTDARRMLWVPQQLGNFRWMPAGLWTVCLHHNTWRAEEVGRFRDRLTEFRPHISGFSEVVARYAGRRARLGDRLCDSSIRLARSVKSLVSRRAM